MRRADLAWRSEATCAAEDVELTEKFFPTGRPSSKPQSICRRCPVREECLEFALASPWRPASIVAGLTPRELMPLWRQRHPHETHTEIQQLLGLR